jgi:hypothetical protein
MEANFGSADVSASGDIKARSANINADPKMQELTHYMRSHQHETRLRESAELEKRVPSAAGKPRSLRAEGCDIMNDKMKTLSKMQADILYLAKSSELPEAFREKPSSQGELRDSMQERMAMLRRMDRFETRIGWRECMDSSLKRLLIDMDLSRDERLKEYEVKAKSQAKMEDALQQKTEKEVQKTRFAQARCEHLDKIYSWYVTHGMKEARKERKAPPYLKYEPNDKVMPGSLRVAPPLRGLMDKTMKPGEGLGHSSSSPALMAAGSMATAGPPGTATVPADA